MDESEERRSKRRKGILRRLLRAKIHNIRKGLDEALGEPIKTKATYPPPSGCGLTLQGPSWSQEQAYRARVIPLRPPKPERTRPRDLPANRDTLNRVSKAMLTMVGRPLNPHHLYCLQLAEWGWKETGFCDGTWLVRVPLFILVMLYDYEPARVMEFLFPADDYEPTYLLELMDPGPIPPVHLAAMVLEQIHYRLEAEIDGYLLSRLPTFRPPADSSS